jgi:transposase
MESSPMGTKKKAKTPRKRRRPRRYSAEFRSKAVLLARRHPERSLKSLSDELGISYDTFVGWVRRAEIEGTLPAPEGETPEQELKRLRRENERLREERDILKKAATFFAKESE